MCDFRLIVASFPCFLYSLAARRFPHFLRLAVITTRLCLCIRQQSLALGSLLVVRQGNHLDLSRPARDATMLLAKERVVNRQPDHPDDCEGCRHTGRLRNEPRQRSPYPFALNHHCKYKIHQF